MKTTKIDIEATKISNLQSTRFCITPEFVKLRWFLEINTLRGSFWFCIFIDSITCSICAHALTKSPCAISKGTTQGEPLYDWSPILSETFLCLFQRRISTMISNEGKDEKYVHHYSKGHDILMPRVKMWCWNCWWHRCWCWGRRWWWWGQWWCISILRAWTWMALFDIGDIRGDDDIGVDDGDDLERWCISILWARSWWPYLRSRLRVMMQKFRDAPDRDIITLQTNMVWQYDKHQTLIMMTGRWIINTEIKTMGISLPCF